MSESNVSSYSRLVIVLCFVAMLIVNATKTSAHGDQTDAKSADIVLVHGFLDTNRKLEALTVALRGAGYRCFAPSLRPNDCRLGVRDLSAKLAAEIDAHFGKSQPIILVGFSMGGLITRDYVQNLADRQRIRGVFLISTPNRGTFWASLAPWRGIRDLCPGSPFLRALNADDTAWKNIPVASYWTPWDLMILPATSSHWAVGEMTRIACPLHPLMVRDRVLIADVLLRTHALTAITAPPRHSSHKT